jgi:Glyoxalase-like domain
MGLLVDCLGFDCADPAAIARFWAEALDYQSFPSDDPNEAAIAPKSGGGMHILFLRVPEGKSVKNRLHLDLRPDDQAAEVERLLALGAKKVDIGQGSPTWVVLADPEGNEFCILRNLTPEERAEQATAP